MTTKYDGADLRLIVGLLTETPPYQGADDDAFRRCVEVLSTDFPDWLDRSVRSDRHD